MLEPIISIILGVVILYEDISFFKITGCSLIAIAVIILMRDINEKEEENSKEQEGELKAVCE